MTTLPLLIVTALAMATATVLPASEQVLAAADIGDATVAAVQARLASQGSTATVELAGRIQAQRLPDGEVRVTLGEIAGRFPRERMGVPVQLWVDGRHHRSMTVWIELHDPREVQTYASDYPAITRGGDIRIEPAIVDMVCCPGSTVASPADLDGQRIRRPVREGEPAMTSDLEAVPDVHAQGAVEIMVRQGAIQLVTTGVALSDGDVGDRVPVRPDQSRRVIQSRVIAQNRVVVHD